MGTFLGNVALRDDECLREIVEDLGYSTDTSSDLPYYCLDAVWKVAEEKMAENDTSSVEVILEGMDFITVYNVGSIEGTSYDS